MKYWFIIDDETRARADIDIECLPERTDREQAYNMALTVWNRKTKHEQKACDSLYIGYAEPAEESDERHIFPDFDTMINIEYIKEG